MSRANKYIILILTLVNIILGQYTPPQARVEPLYPRGLKISIPDEKGISLVAFHIKFNEEFEGIEAGTIARDILRVRNGRWTYQDNTTNLKFGDVVHYWVHVVYNGLGYNLLFQQHEVTKFYNPDGTKVNLDGVSTSIQPSQVCAFSPTKIVDLSTGTYQNTCTGELIFEDNFQTLNDSIWRHVERFPRIPDYAFVTYRDNERNIKIKSNKLHLIPTLVENEYGKDFIRYGNLTLERCTGIIGTVQCSREAFGPYVLPAVFSGYVDTKKSFAFIYGKIEIRAKLPRGDWIYPILSLLPLNDAKAMNYPELRIATTSGNTVLRSSGGADLSGHVLCSGGIQRNFDTPKRPDNPRRFATDYWFEEYHTYQLEWSQNRITVKVDNVEYGSMNGGPPFDKPFYIALGVAVGGHEEFPDMSMSDGYIKPWKNVGSKALLDFYNATPIWSRTWQENLKDLSVEHVKVWAI
ncbi:beta-1,3-glucan-binding protein 1-like [Chelonus insularis]|uniref:beta-1,3-glucan-binding protein 1-like n=1 Tax=Chelonus insularis TaxID=460826 RepID=UPI00158B9812|nr:beta-1,3-glucan-binding protein 1-like [Chelonus insularis]